MVADIPWYLDLTSNRRNADVAPLTVANRRLTPPTNESAVAKNEAFLEHVSKESSILIDTLIEPAVWASPEATVREVKEILRADEAISSVVVAAGGRPVGLVMGLHLDRICVASSDSRSTIRSRSPGSWSAAAGCRDRHSPRHCRDRAVRREGIKIFDHIVVTNNGLLEGIVSIPSILDSLAFLEHEQSPELTDLNSRLREEVVERQAAASDLQHSREMLQLVINTLPPVHFLERNRPSLPGLQL